MMCTDANELIDGFTDGELDLVTQIQIERHLDECWECEGSFQARKSMSNVLARDEFYFRAPASLREKVLTDLEKAEKESFFAKINKIRWLPLAITSFAAAAVILAVLFFLMPTTSNEELLANEFVTAHIRSMMVDHLTDVASTDQHTVKPWFGGKLDFSPVVKDLAAQGFPLIGGRLDYAEGRPVAALVYERRQHRINVFVYPSDTSGDSQMRSLQKQGFNVVHWKSSGMAYWAVSDLNRGELEDLARLVQSQ